MPARKARPTLTDREALFVSAVSRGSSYVDAYTAAGYKRDRGNATHLATRLQSQIELRRQAVEATQQITAEWWREKYLAVWRKVENESPDAALRALDIGAKVLGLYDHQQGAPVELAAQLLAAILGNRNNQQPQLPEAQPPAIHGAYQVLEAKKDEGA